MLDMFEDDYDGSITDECSETCLEYLTSCDDLGTSYGCGECCRCLEGCKVEWERARTQET